MYYFFWNDNVVGIIYALLGVLFGVAIIVISITLRIKEHKRRKTCELAPTCPRKGICMSCLNYKNKNKKGEQK